MTENYSTHKHTHIFPLKIHKTSTVHITAIVMFAGTIWIESDHSENNSKTIMQRDILLYVYWVVYMYFAIDRSIVM